MMPTPSLAALQFGELWHLWHPPVGQRSEALVDRQTSRPAHLARRTARRTSRVLVPAVDPTP